MVCATQSENDKREMLTIQPLFFILSFIPLYNNIIYL